MSYTYYRPPDNTIIELYDEVEVMSGEHRGVTGVVGSTDAEGWVKIWPNDESVDPTTDGKLWIQKPDLRCLKKVNKT